MQPRVSVIIPVYNGTNYLREAIESVFSQTYAAREVVVVDDGSKDGTWDLIQSYGSSVRGIRKENGGVASALNCGIRHAAGDYIAWLSHDDLFLPTKLERQVEFLKEFPQFKACYTDYYTIDGSGRILGETECPWYPRHQAMAALFGRSYIDGSTIMIERDCFERVGLFSERLRVTQDTEMWLRLLRYYEIGRVPEKLGKWRFHGEQGSRAMELLRNEGQMMYRQVFEEFGMECIRPKWKKPVTEPRVLAGAYTWLGDTMSIHRAWYDFADQLYGLALEKDPSWRNQARLKRLMNRGRCLARPLYRSLRGAMWGWGRAIGFKG